MSTPGAEDSLRTRPADVRDVPTGGGTDAEEQARAEEQVRAEERARLRRGRVVTAVVAAVVVVAVGLVALLSGFERRRDLVTPVSPGSVVATGPYEVTLDRASLQRTTSTGEWEVVVHGTARTTGSTSITPAQGDDGFVYAKDVASGEAQPVYSVALGQSTSYEHVDNLTPGLPPVPWALTFRFSHDPGSSVLLAVFQQEYTTPYLFSDEMGWRSTSDASTMTLPLERLPDKEY